jgi:hypothetical protein
MTHYDSNILQQYADQLYRQARAIAIWTALLFGFAVFVSGNLLLAVVESASRALGGNGQGVVLFATLLAVAVGIGTGRRKSFGLKLQAQQILCQREIELNTRSTGKAVAAIPKAQ